MILIYKIVIAAVSGLVCFAVYDIPSGKIPGGESLFGSLFFYCALVGLPFSAGVLFPYIHGEKGVLVKGITLIFTSGISFLLAVFVVSTTYGVTWNWGSPGMPIFVAASLVGASVMLIGARYVIPLSNLSGLLAVGLFAAVPGGIIFGALDDKHWYWAFMAWNGLMATSIHIAEIGYPRARRYLKSKSE